MSTRYRLVLFGLVVLLQLWVPLRGILRYEAALRAGAVYKVRVEPVDPEDPFRGRYLAVRLVLDGDVEIDPPADEAWATIEADPDGFARALATSASRPATGDAVRVRRSWRSRADGEGRETALQLTVDRYYMNERAARAVDRRMWSRNGTADASYALVRVKDGVAALEAIVVDGRPL